MLDLTLSREASLVGSFVCSKLLFVVVGVLNQVLWPIAFSFGHWQMTLRLFATTSLPIHPIRLPSSVINIWCNSKEDGSTIPQGR